MSLGSIIEDIQYHKGLFSISLRLHFKRFVQHFKRFFQHSQRFFQHSKRSFSHYKRFSNTTNVSINTANVFSTLQTFLLTLQLRKISPNNFPKSLKYSIFKIQLFNQLTHFDNVGFLRP